MPLDWLSAPSEAWECELGIKWKEWSCRVCIYVQHSTVSLMSLLEEVYCTGIEL